MTYSTFRKDYLPTIALSDPVINSIEMVDDWADIIGLQMDRAHYPCLVIEIHEVSSDTESAAVDYTITGAFAVITGTPADENKSFYKDIEDINLAAITRIQQKITCDSDAEGIFEADLKTEFQPIRKATADNCYGWRAYFSISGIEQDE